MGKTIVSNTVGSGTIANDDDVDVKGPAQVPSPVVTFTTFGTGPVVNAVERGPGRLRLRVTSGTGAGTAAVNNIILTFPVGTRPARKVYVGGDVTLGFQVSSIAANVINIGCKVNSVASTPYEVDLIIVF